jgi:creatinine amidohydrolase
VKSTLPPALAVLLACPSDAAHSTLIDRPGVELGELTWVEAERVLGPDTIVVIPLGAASKEHGPHLRLDNDWQLAEYFKARVLASAQVVVAPTIGYHYYPAFVEYPGSISLRAEVARDLVIDACASLAAYGPRRFYVLNTGISTVAPLREAADALAERGILMRFTDLGVLAPIEERIAEQPGGTHADEIETSMMLYIAPDRVDMSKAVRDWRPKQGKGFNREPGGSGTWSASGVWGDATLASVDKGRVIVEALTTAILDDLARLRAEPTP